MNRKKFLSCTTAGFSGFLAGPGLFRIANALPRTKAVSYPFRRYRPESSLGEVYQVTPPDGYYMHTFYDVCPWSPSGRYLAVTKLPFQGRKPVLGDMAEAAVIDLENRTIRSVYRTAAWSFQLGANLQWGRSDRYLYTNDLIGYMAVGIRIDLETGETTAYAGPKYDIDNGETALIGSRLELMNATQYGYGIPDNRSGIPVYGYGHEEEDGLWYTTLKGDRKKLLLSFARVRKAISAPEYYRNGTFYFFHSKFNPRGDRVMQVARCLIPGVKGRNPSLFTLDLAQDRLFETLDRERWEARGPIGGGNHPNWHPDGEHIVMNLVPAWEGDDKMRFCLFRYDGSERKVLSRTLPGSGHPSVEPRTRYLVTDAYPHQEWVASENGEVPIRLIDLERDEERTVCRIFTDLAGKAGLDNYKVKEGGSHFKLDPHPAWSRDYKKICFNGVPEGNRQVFIADLGTVLD